MRFPKALPQIDSTTPAAALALFATLLSCGCSTAGKLDRPRRATSVRDAGSVHLAVLAVAPWHHYAAALQPNFQLAADQALGIVIQDSRRGEESILSALTLSGAVSHDAGDPTESGQDTPDIEISSFKSSPLAPWEQSAGGDAMLRYSAATSLYQEVQLLNRYVRDAAIPNGHRAYVVRLQVSLMPRRRHQPYDTYATVSFFTTPGDATVEAGQAAGGAADSASALVPNTSLRGADSLFELPEGVGAPRVLPLLVSDNLESSLESKSAQTIRAIRMSLLGLWDQSGANIGAAGVESGSSDQVFGRDLNGLLTVARLSENTLRIRLGAMQEATTDHAMVPRNHYVTLLLMVPESAGDEVQAVAKTELIDTQNGKQLGGTEQREIRRLFKRIEEDYRIGGVKRDVLNRLLGDAQRNDQRAFSRRLRDASGGVSDSVAQSLWLDLVSLMAGSQYASSRFELPGHGTHGVETTEIFYQQTAVVLDDFLRSSIVLRGASFSETAAVEAILDIEVDGRPISLPAESIHLDGPSREIRLTFPSLARLGLADAAMASGALRVTLDMAGELVDFEALYLRARDSVPWTGPLPTR